MGMFDYISFDKSIDLPISKEFKKLKVDPHELEFQTKSLENTLSEYFVSKNKRLYKDGKKTNYHGMIDFGSYYDTDTIAHVSDYQAKFTDGVLKYIKLNKYESIEHDSRQLQKSNYLEKIKKENNKPKNRIIFFIQKYLLIAPLKLFGIYLKSNSPGFLGNEKFSLSFYSPKLILGRSSFYGKNFGVSLSEVTTEALLTKNNFSTKFSLRLLGFGFSVMKYDSINFNEELDNLSKEKIKP